MRFEPEDRHILQQLVLDPVAEPNFELLKACLVWPDERPERISEPGYELLRDLWSVRGFMHRNVPVENWGLEPGYFQSVWDYALQDVPQWPGFKRIQLSDAERAYLSQCLAETAKGELPQSPTCAWEWSSGQQLPHRG